MRILKLKSLPSQKEECWIDRDEIFHHACFQIFEDYFTNEFPSYMQVEDPREAILSYIEWWKDELKEMKDYLNPSECQYNLKWGQYALELWDYWQERKQKDWDNKYYDVDEINFRKVSALTDGRDKKMLHKLVLIHGGFWT